MVARLKERYRTLVILPLLVFSAAPVLWSLFGPGFFVSDDGEWMIIRFSAFHQALADGQFPVRWLGRLNHEYGYPVANFLYPGFMYFAEPIHLLGFGFVDSIKILLGLSMLGSAIFIYLWLAKFFGKWESFIGSLLYLYAPYHLYDLYQRGSVGEVLALALAPFVFWQIERRSLFWSTLGIAGLMLSHNTLAILFFPLIIFYMLLDVLIAEKKKKLIFNYGLILLLALGSSSFFWVPAIFDLQYTVFAQTAVSNLGEYFANQNLIGAPSVIVFLLVLTLFLVRKIEASKHRLTALLFVIGLISIFFSTSPSSFLWLILPSSFIQFPFRFLSVTILSASFLAACLLSVLSKRWKIATGLLILLLTLVSSRSFIAPSKFFDKGEGFYATNEATTTVKGEYMPRWAKVISSERARQKVEIVKGEGEISLRFVNSRQINLSTNLKADSLIRINTLYFPGWQAWVDEQKVAIDYENEKGLIQIPLPQGRHQVSVKFGETPLRLFSDIISFISLGALYGLILKKGAFSRRT